MKKTLVSALTTALVVGAASTTFAAANPFEDVPADHWAYDAVAQLAKDGVVEGYGDGTYVGDAAITRYEMAQMVAKAMTKSDLKHADKAMVEKLAAEFADELNNLGVRVAKLEKKVDNLKYSGYYRYTWNNTRVDGRQKPHGNKNDMRIRLFLESEINEHWTGKARIEYIHNMKTAANVPVGTDSTNQIIMNRAYAEGNYDNLNIKLGKFPGYTMVDDGMIFDDDMSGAELTFGKKVKVKLAAGRYKTADADAVNMQSIEVYDKSSKFTWGLGYTNVKAGIAAVNLNERFGIWSVGLGYHFDKDWYFHGAYARGNAGSDNILKSKMRTAYNIELDYKDADKSKPGTWGAWIAYRHLGYISIAPTYNSFDSNRKGFQIGTKITLMKNVLGYLEFFKGKEVDGDRDVRTLFGRVEAFF